MEVSELVFNKTAIVKIFPKVVFLLFGNCAFVMR